MSSETSVVPAQSSGGISAQLRAGLLTWPVMMGAFVLLMVVALALLAPWISHYNPIDIDPSQRLKAPSALHWLGTDALGRDIFARVAFGARQSLVVGLGAVCISVVIGLAIGVVAGYFRLVDAIVMRVMDGVMAIPGILLAIALVSLSGASLFTVLVAISIPEIPRVVRMVRSVIMGVRNESYVEAAVILGTPVPVIMWRHMLPSTVAPLIVQGTYIFASAILTEAILSFLGAGIPPEIPSWGNIMADGRVYFMMLPGMILYPGILVSLTVLSVNVLGDAVRDALDPRMAKRL
ncbi:ABC transporter permease [Brenneria populi]|uniref:ABC transporter permease n=1 Tax=Brenneria populi TaxID=1505588 RepID=A0ABU6JW22_9GAMM|nr:ABC transporter permease [Brenneria populi Li et al. 2015]